jgi:hypothetical protein
MSRIPCARDGCPNTFDQPSGRGRRRKYCSVACKNLARRPGTPWADEPYARAVRRATADRGALRPLQSRLEGLGWPISFTTISNWQTGRTLPIDTPDGRARVMALETVLKLKPGTLMRAWQDTRLRDTPTVELTAPSPAAALLRPATGELYNKETLKNEMIGRVEAAGGWLSRNYLVITAVEDDYLLGPDGRPLRRVIGLTAYALRPGIDQYWYLHAFRGTEPDVKARIVPQINCRLGAELSLEQMPPSRKIDELVMASELRFDQPLEPFRPHRFSYAVDYVYDNNPTSHLKPEFIRVVPTPGTRYLRLSITFDNRALPHQLSRCVWKPDSNLPDGGFNTPVTKIHVLRTEPDRWTLNMPPTPRGYGWTWTGLDDRVPATNRRTPATATT